MGIIMMVRRSKYTVDNFVALLFTLDQAEKMLVSLVGIFLKTKFGKRRAFSQPIVYEQANADLPRGVVSKKDMGERRILMSMVLCSREAAFKVNTW